MHRLATGGRTESWCTVDLAEQAGTRAVEETAGSTLPANRNDEFVVKVILNPRIPVVVPTLNESWPSRLAPPGRKQFRLHPVGLEPYSMTSSVASVKTCAERVHPPKGEFLCTRGVRAPTEAAEGDRVNCGFIPRASLKRIDQWTCLVALRRR